MPRCKNASSGQETAAEEKERPWRREGSKYIHIQTGLAFNTGASVERFQNIFLTKEIVSPKIVNKDLFKSATYAPNHRDLKFRNSSNPSVINLTLIQRVQQYIFSYVLLPRDSNHGIVNKDDIRLFHVLLNDVKFDWVHFFIVALSDGTRFSHLRFAIPIMHILAHCKIDFTRDTQVPVKKTCFITEAKFSRIVYREEGDAAPNLDLIVAEEEEESQNENQAESSQAGGSRATERVTLIKSTVGGTKVKLSQKKLGEKLRLPNSGVEVGKFPVKNLDWNIIGISGQVPSGPAKKADLNNDYKLVLELVIACLECGSGGHADDITHERAFIINSLITKTKVNWAAHFFKSISKHLGKHNQKYLCQDCQEKACGVSLEAPQNLAPINLEEEESSDQGKLQRKKKRKINSPSTSGNVNPDELKEKEPAEETSAQNRSPQQLEEEIPQVQSLPTSSPQPQIDDADNQFWQLYYDWKAWKVGNSAEQLLNWDQQLKNERIIKKCLGIPVNHNSEQILDDYWVWQRNPENLHLEYLANTPVSDFEADDEDPAVF
ncbi:unnamed protein product, partial [Cuscuta campestris]